MAPASPWQRANDALARAGRAFSAVLLLCIRLYWGFQYFQTGLGKWSHLGRTAHFFASLRLPAPHLSAIVVAVTEGIGGLLLMAGVATRFLTPIFIFEMLVAFVTADREAFGAIFSDPDKFTGAAPFLFLAAFLVLFAFGAGPLSVDGLIFRRPPPPSSPP